MKSDWCNLWDKTAHKSPSTARPKRGFHFKSELHTQSSGPAVQHNNSSGHTLAAVTTVFQNEQRERRKFRQWHTCDCVIRNDASVSVVMIEQCAIHCAAASARLCCASQLSRCSRDDDRSTWRVRVRAGCECPGSTQAVRGPVLQPSPQHRVSLAHRQRQPPLAATQQCAVPARVRFQVRGVSKLPRSSSGNDNAGSISSLIAGVSRAGTSCRRPACLRVLAVDKTVDSDAGVEVEEQAVSGLPSCT